MHADLAEIAGEGMTAVMPYDSPKVDPKTYLDKAAASGVRVLVELPRRFVKAGDGASIMEFVDRYRSHAALLGWYLADEPSTTKALGPLHPRDAVALYQVIKSIDRTHPVAIAFGPTEDPQPYRHAMDVMMFDNYPCWVGKPEFSYMGAWAASLRRAADIAKSEEGFFPIIQAYAHPPKRFLEFGPRHRLPTPAEARYMSFTAVQEDATGVFYWTRYRSDQPWVDTVLRPILKQLDGMKTALAAGPRSGVVGVGQDDVRAVAFRDPITGVAYIVSVHHGDGTVEAPIRLRGSLADVESVTLLADPPQEIAVNASAIPQRLGPYAVNVFRLRS